jgi:type IV secretory pathway VirJ component
MTARLVGMALVIAMHVGTQAVPAGQPPTLTVPAFGRVVLYAPPRPPDQVVLFISGDGGWNLGVVSMAERLRDLGALVVGIDIRTFLKNLESAKGCAYPAGALEELSRAVQQHLKLPAYKRPIIVGYSSGASLAYAALVSAPPETFAGAISLGFCPTLEFHTPVCQMRGLKTSKAKSVGVDMAPFPGLTVPWMVLHGEADQVCSPPATRAFVGASGASRLFSLPSVGHGFGVPRNWEPQFIEAYRAIAASSADAGRPGSLARVADLSLVEVAVTGGRDTDLMAILLTGDGGWAAIDKGIAAELAGVGVPVVGWSSLTYYWTPRTPEVAAGDLARVIEHYARFWGKTRVLLIGYSFGANVLPFLVSRLPASSRARVAGVSLLGLSETAHFEFHLASWLGGAGRSRYQTVAEVARLAVPVTCVFGVDESDSACRLLTGPHVKAVAVGRGHHFGDDYARVVEVILRRGK